MLLQKADGLAKSQNIIPLFKKQRGVHESTRTSLETGFPVTPGRLPAADHFGADYGGAVRALAHAVNDKLGIEPEAPPG